jgi:hypothetical protein
MRIWRALKALGCAALRDGAWLLPASAGREPELQALADECVREGGNAWLMAVQPRSDDEDAAYRARFDRGADYAALRASWKEANVTLASMATADVVRLARKLQREREALRAIDFFPGEASADAEAAWSAFARRIERAVAPDEPHETRGAVPRLDPRDYQGRTWATRQRLWVDRVASAWLIRRFIDHDARLP